MKTCSEVRIDSKGRFDGSLTLSKAVEHERGCVATKIGLIDIFVGSRPSAQTMLQVDAGQLANRRKVSTTQVIALSQKQYYAYKDTMKVLEILTRLRTKGLI